MLRGNFLAIFAVILASTYTIFNKILVVDLPPITLAAVSQGISVFVLLLFFGVLPSAKKILQMPLKQVTAMILMGVLGTVTGTLLFLKGLEHTSAVNAILLAEMDTIFTPLIASLWLKEKVSGNQISGTLLMLGGLYFIFTEGLHINLSLHPGDLLIAGSALSFAISLNIFKKYLHNVPSEQVVLVSDTIGVSLLFFAAPTLLNMQHHFAPIFDPSVFKYLLVFAVIGIAISRFLWFKAVDNIPASRASAISLLSPVLALIMATVILKEHVQIFHMVGGALVIVGLSLAVFHEQMNPQHQIHEKAKAHH